MDTRAKIKVIKKGAVKVIETPDVSTRTHEPNNATKLASTVSDWISEFQHRRREETETAIERFNSDSPDIEVVLTKI